MISPAVTIHIFSLLADWYFLLDIKKNNICSFQTIKHLCRADNHQNQNLNLKQTAERCPLNPDVSLSPPSNEFKGNGGVELEMQV